MDRSYTPRLLIVREGSSLPTPTVDHFLVRAVVQIAATADEEYICLRTATGTYAWVNTTVTIPTPTITVESNDVVIDSAVTTIDFDPAFTVVRNPAGETTIALNPNVLSALTADGYINREVEIDFTAPITSTVFWIEDPDISDDMIVTAAQSGKCAAGQAADENEFDALVLSANPGNGGFTLFVSAFPGPVLGPRVISYRAVLAA